MLPISLLYPFEGHLAMLFCSDTVTHQVTLQARLALRTQLRLTLNSRPSRLGFSKCRDLKRGEPGLAVVSVCGDDSPRMLRLCVCEDPSLDHQHPHIHTYRQRQV